MIVKNIKDVETINIKDVEYQGKTRSNIYLHC